MDEAARYITGRVYPINIAAIATTAIYTPDSGRRFVVERVYIRADAANTVTFKSGTTALSGPVTFAANDVLSEPASGTGPVLIGRVSGEAFQITTTTADQLSGWALITEIA